MRQELVALFNRLKETATFDNVSFDDVNATTVDGDNALHWAARQNDLAAARLLIRGRVSTSISTEICDLLGPLMVQAPQADRTSGRTSRLICCGGRSHVSRSF